MRGLKREFGLIDSDGVLSHPTRVRGLKQSMIRTSNNLRVAPHTGAWIETGKHHHHPTHQGSHPTRVRGLKLDLTITNNAMTNVAPHTGAWIETVRE